MPRISAAGDLLLRDWRRAVSITRRSTSVNSSSSGLIGRDGAAGLKAAARVAAGRSSAATRWASAAGRARRRGPVRGSCRASRRGSCFLSSSPSRLFPGRAGPSRPARRARPICRRSPAGRRAVRGPSRRAWEPGRARGSTRPLAADGRESDVRRVAASGGQGSPGRGPEIPSGRSARPSGWGVGQLSITRYVPVSGPQYCSPQIRNGIHRGLRFGYDPIGFASEDRTAGRSP